MDYLDISNKKLGSFLFLNILCNFVIVIENKFIMKHIILFFLFLIVCTSAYSQIADTQFGELYNSVIQKLNNRFGNPDYKDDSMIEYSDKNYANRDWDHIRFSFKPDEDGNEHLNSNCLGKDFKNLETAKKFLFDLKAILPYNFSLEDDISDELYSYTANENNTTIDLCIYKDEIEKNKYTVWLDYNEYTTNYKIQDLSSSILYTNFGDSYDKTSSILESRFGEPATETRDYILYEYVDFAQLKWTTAFFKFQYTTSTSHLTDIVLSKGCNNSNSALFYRDLVKNIKIDSAKWYSAIDKNGFKVYRGYYKDRVYNISIEKNVLKDYPYLVCVSISTNIYRDEDKL